MPVTEPSQRVIDQVAARCSPRIFLDLCCGFRRPLSRALLDLGADVLSIDKLCNLQHDLLNNDFMETLLRIGASGIVSYTAASPSCNEYSMLLKLKPGALKPCDHHNIWQDYPTSILRTCKKSKTVMPCFRIAFNVSITSGAGGDGHLEQPTTAMSWSEPCVQQWILQASCYCVNLPACLYGADWRKSWMMASSFAAMTSLGGTCEHGPTAHQSKQGVRDASGEFKNRSTAEYPSALAASFAAVVFPILSQSQSRYDSGRCYPIDAPQTHCRRTIFQT